MRCSVVINTYNRAPSLRATLDALEHQTHDDFEVVVVNGPSDDGTAELLASRAAKVRTVDCPQRNLSVSRNLGIEAAAGEVVAFIDDDAVPEPRWLEQLEAAYAEGEHVGGAGGLVRDHSGVHLQYRFSVCDRIGHTDFERTPPFVEENRPGADPYVYLQGTNASFRREVLRAVGGFDEEIEYNYDESEVCLQVIDAGWQLRPVDGAAVHHKFLPSHMRREKGLFTDPYLPVKNRAYFAIRNGRGVRAMSEILTSLTDYLAILRSWALDSARHGRFSEAEATHFIHRMQAGFELGVERGMRGERRSRAIGPADRGAFLPFSTRRPPGRRLRVAFVTLDYPPQPLGGIARFTHDLARGFAAAGHEAHVVTRAPGPQRTDLEEGVWVHRHPEGARHLPHLGDHPLRDNLAHLAAVFRSLDRLQEREPLDVVTGNLWIAEPLVAALDPRPVVAMTCSTPMRVIAATQPAVAAQPHTPWQIRLEDAALVRADHLQPVSQANLETVRREVPAAADVPATVVWHGMVDRRDEVVAPPREDDLVELLFVGRLEPRKGVDALLEAAVTLLRERPQARLRLAGADNPHAAADGRTYAARVDDALAGEPDLRARVVFEGEVSDERLYELHASCDVFVAPSRYESFGLVNVEAMMFGKPVVSCRAGGIPEVVVDGETGLLVEPDDADGLREALRRLVDDPDLRARLGAAGRARFEAEFDNDVAVARTAALYERLGAERTPPVAADHEAVVRAGVRDLLAELEVPEPAAAAEELLAPWAFPHDHLATVLRLMPGTDRDFVEGLYREILGRWPEPEGLEGYLVALAGGALGRLDIVRDVATSDEAVLLGVDQAFLAHLDAVDPSELERRARDAFWRDDATFAARLGGLLGGEEDGERLAQRVRERLAAGRTRRQVVAELVTDDAVADRLPGATRLLELELLTPPELEGRLRELAQRPAPELVAGLYRLLLGREPDDGARGWEAQLGHGTPLRAVAVAIASSPEAQRRGVDPVVVDAAATGVRVRRRPHPRAALRRVARARPGAGDGALRAELAGLRAALDRAERVAAERHAALVGIAGVEAGVTPALDRVAAEVRHASASSADRDAEARLRAEDLVARVDGVNDLVARSTGEGGIPWSEPGTLREFGGAADRRTTYDALAEVAARHRADPPTAAEAEELRRLPLTAWERCVMSQWGEDGVIAEVLRRIGPGEVPAFVEFGVQSGREANTSLLALLGWRGVMLEASERDARWLARRYGGAPGVRTAHAWVWPETVEALFAEHGVPEEPAVLSIDIDSVDWWVWRAITSYRPRLVVVEYNGHAPENATLPEDAREGWDGTSYFGASIGALERLGRVKGYRLVHTELAGSNAFFVRADLDRALPDPDVVPRRHPNYNLRDGHHRPDPHRRPWVVVGEDGEPSGTFDPAEEDA